MLGSWGDHVEHQKLSGLLNNSVFSRFSRPEVQGQGAPGHAPAHGGLLEVFGFLGL